MSVGDEVFRRIQSAARSVAAQTGAGAPTQEHLVRHTLESFLDRLTRTAHAEDFVLEGGILLAVNGVRRPTKDADANAVSADVTVEHLDTYELLRSVQAVARYRGVTLEPIAPYVVGYRQVGQAKWAVWRRKERLEEVCEADLDEQMALVASYLDPVFSQGRVWWDSAPRRP